MSAAEPMRFAGILQRQFLAQKRGSAVSYTPGTEHFHQVTPFITVPLSDIRKRKSRTTDSRTTRSQYFQRDSTLAWGILNHSRHQKRDNMAMIDVFCLHSAKNQAEQGYSACGRSFIAGNSGGVRSTNEDSLLTRQ